MIQRSPYDHIPWNKENRHSYCVFVSETTVQKAKTKNSNASFSQWNVQFRVICVTDSKLLGVFHFWNKNGNKDNKNFIQNFTFIRIRTICIALFECIFECDCIYCMWCEQYMGPVCMSVFSTVHVHILSIIYFIFSLSFRFWFLCVCVLLCFLEWQQRKLFKQKSFLPCTDRISAHRQQVAAHLISFAYS